MPKTTLQAHFDGKQIVLDEPFSLKPNDRLLVTIVGVSADEDEQSEWIEIAENSLSRAYNENEPEYTLGMIKEPNPKYESR